MWGSCGEHLDSKTYSVGHTVVTSMVFLIEWAEPQGWAPSNDWQVGWDLQVAFQRLVYSEKHFLLAEVCGLLLATATPAFSSLFLIIAEL